MTALAYASEQFDRIAERVPGGELPVADPNRNLWYVRRARAQSATYPLMSPNLNGWLNAFCVDIDAGWTPAGASESHLRCLDAWAKPNLVMVNPDNGHAHATFLLSRPVYVKSTSRKGIEVANLAKDIKRRVRLSLGGDPSYTNSLVKNPFCHDFARDTSKWTTHLLRSHLYEFDELLELPACPRITAANDSEAALIGRNANLFEFVRHVAYRDPASAVNRQTVLAWVEELNFSLYAENPVDHAECTHIAKSIARFMREDWRGHDGPHRLHLWEGRISQMSFTDESPIERKQAGARYVAELKRRRTGEAVIGARVQLGSTLHRNELPPCAVSLCPQ